MRDVHDFVDRSVGATAAIWLCRFPKIYRAPDPSIRGRHRRTRKLAVKMLPAAETVKSAQMPQTVLGVIGVCHWRTTDDNLTASRGD